MAELPKIHIIDIGYASAGVIDTPAESPAESSPALEPSLSEGSAEGNNG